MKPQRHRDKEEYIKSKMREIRKRINVTFLFFVFTYCFLFSLCLCASVVNSFAAGRLS